MLLCRALLARYEELFIICSKCTVVHPGFLIWGHGDLFLGGDAIYDGGDGGSVALNICVGVMVCLSCKQILVCVSSLSCPAIILLSLLWVSHIG